MFVASTASGLQTRSSSANSSRFGPSSSTIASITTSQSANAERSVVRPSRPMSKESSWPFSTLRVRKCSIRPRAVSPSSPVTSRPTVSRPASTASCAMPAPIVPSPTTPTFTRRSLTGYELGTELLQRARECCPEALVPVRGDRDPHGTQGAMAVTARVRLGLRKCPLPASGGCRRYQCRPLSSLVRMGASGCGTRGRCGQLESRRWTCARAPLPSAKPRPGSA